MENNIQYTLEDLDSHSYIDASGPLSVYNKEGVFLGITVANYKRDLNVNRSKNLNDR
jgi:hypothetical protein